MEKQITQVDKVFENNKLAENSKEIERFIRQFDTESDLYWGQKEDQLRQSVGSINDEMVRLVDRSKQNNDLQKIITKSKINSIKQNYEQIIDQTQQIIKYQQNRFNQMMMKHDGRQLEQIKQLRKCNKNKVNIEIYSDLDDYKKKIEQHQQHNRQYRISVCFDHHSMNSRDSQMSVLQMIDILNANSRVARISITSNRNHGLNIEVLKLMIDRYTNVYEIVVSNNDDRVNYEMHDLVKQYVQQQPIMRFELMLRYGPLHSNDYGLNLIKQYNQLIKQKQNQHLEFLVYEHAKIGGYKEAPKQRIEKLIDEVDKL